MDPHILPLRMQESRATFENTRAVSIKYILNLWSSNPMPRYLLKKMRSLCPHKDLYSNVQSSFIFYSHWHQPKCPSIGEQLNQLWYICSMEYSSAVKRNKVGMHATRCINLKCSMLSKITQTENTTYRITPFR